MSDRGTSKAQPRLVLHLDINETLILSDPAGGDSYVDSLNKIIAKLALVRPVTDAPADAALLARWTWVDGTPLDPAARENGAPPPPLAYSTWDVPSGAVRFYAVDALKRRFARAFCTAPDSPGRVYSRVYADADAKLRWPEGARTDSPLCRVEAGIARHFILPAALVAIRELHRRGREFQIVVRTFGTDLHDVAAALSSFARGSHPDFPLDDLSAPALSDTPIGQPTDGPPPVRIPQAELRAHNCFTGRYAPSGFTLAPAPGARAMGVLTDETEIARFVAWPARLGGAAGAASAVRASPALGIADDYLYWSANGCAPWAGKPLWLGAGADADDDDDDEGGNACDHIFFDDNIHDNASDSIVAVRVRELAPPPIGACAADGGGAYAQRRYAPLSGEASRALRGLALVPVPTLRAVLDDQWMLREIDATEARLAKARGAAHAAGYGADWVRWVVDQARTDEYIGGASSRSCPR